MILQVLSNGALLSLYMHEKKKYIPRMLKPIVFQGEMYSSSLMLSGPSHLIYGGLYLSPCSPWYISTGFICEEKKKIDHFLITSLNKKISYEFIKT